MADTIPEKMKAARVLEKGHEATLKPRTSYKIETVPVPTPTGRNLLLKTGAAGLCHTDLMVLNGELGAEKYPVTASHEPCGTVVKLGEEAEKKGKVKIGDRVAAMLHVGVCHECTDCRKFDRKYCPNSSYAGINTDGAFAEYCIVDADTCVPLPDDFPFEQAAPLTCAGITIYTAIKKANLKPGQLKREILAISGLGALGHLGVQLAKVMGLKIVGIDARPEPIEMTRGLKIGPDLIIDASKTSAEDAVKQIHKLRPKDYDGWEGADAVILTADPKPAQKYAADILRRHGLYVVVSQPPTLEFEFANFVFKDITVVGSLHGNDKDLKELLDLVVKHGIKSEVVGYPMEKHEEMLEAVHAEGRKGKVVMSF